MSWSRPLDKPPGGNIRRIDQIAVDVLRWFWKRLLASRYHLWLWWRFTFREPYTDPGQANDSLSELCGYKVQASTEAKLKCCLPGFFRFKFGVLVFFVPIQQSSRHWTLCWARWVNDPLELYLVRSAARGVAQPAQECSVVSVSRPIRNDRQRRRAPASGLGFFDSVSSGELEGLLGK